MKTGGAMQDRAPCSRLSMKAEARIRTVTFDVGGTLIRPWPSVGHVYAETAAGHGVKRISPEDIEPALRGGVAEARRISIMGARNGRRWWTKRLPG